MTATTLDTHEVVKELKVAGFTEEQAEAVTRAVRRVQDVDLGNLVTKADLKADLAELKADILKWMFGTIGFQTLIIIGAVVALSRMAVH